MGDVIFEIALSDTRLLVRKQYHVPEGKKDLPWKDLSKYVGYIFSRRDMLGCAHTTIAKCTYPFLTCIDILELGALSRAIGEDLGCHIIKFEHKGIREPISSTT